jgi:hypothetical protein
MKCLPVAAALTLFLAGPTVAPATSQSAKMTGRQLNRNQPQNNQSVRQEVMQNLMLAGVTDIKIMPESFLVRAKDKSGNPVMMVINPDSVTAVAAYSNQKSASTAGSTTSNGTAGGK